jgi:hypothetical protein
MTRRLAEGVARLRRPSIGLGLPILRGAISGR